jgi:hypothetical protein
MKPSSKARKPTSFLRAKVRARLVVAFSPHPATHPKSGALNGGIHLTGSSCVICLMAPRSCQMPDDKIAICCCRSFATEAPPSSCSSHRPLSKQHQKNAKDKDS